MSPGSFWNEMVAVNQYILFFVTSNCLKHLFEAVWEYIELQHNMDPLYSPVSHSHAVLSGTVFSRNTHKYFSCFLRQLVEINHLRVAVEMLCLQILPEVACILHVNGHHSSSSARWNMRLTLSYFLQYSMKAITVGTCSYGSSISISFSPANTSRQSSENSRFIEFEELSPCSDLSRPILAIFRRPCIFSQILYTRTDESPFFEWNLSRSSSLFSTLEKKIIYCIW